MALPYGIDARNALAGAAVFLLGLAGAAAPFILGWDPMQYGFGIAAISLFISLLGALTFAAFLLRALKAQEILSGKGVLARWSYSKKEWDAYAELQFREEKSSKAGLFAIVAAACLAIGGAFAVLDPEAGPSVLGVLLGVAFLVGMVAFAVPRLEHARNKRGTGSAVIAEDGCVVNGYFHSWRMFGATLDAVAVKEDDAVPRLEIAYSAPSRTGRQEAVARIPIPKGKLDEAKQVARKLAESVR
jgi:hypothetical protein